MWLRFVLLLCSIGCKPARSLFYPVVNPSTLYNYHPPENDVTFFLYHYWNLSQPIQIWVDDPKSFDQLDPNLDTKVLIHGWSHKKDVPWLVEMREVMAKTRLWNVIVVDWAPLSHAVYVEARVHTPVVSKQVFRLLFNLNRFTGINMSGVHLIGHSMGAQIAGYVGLKVHETTMKKVGRITGLDPAGPLYEWPHMEYLDEVLDSTDADFVDVIHTNAGRIGSVIPGGHLDFYPNGGEIQPGCESWSCSHIRATEYWTVSIKNPSLFRAFLYSDWLLHRNVTWYPMGIAANKSFPHGTYYLEVDLEFKNYLEKETTIKDSWE